MNVHLKSILVILTSFFLTCGQAQITRTLIFPLQSEHVHGSSIVALPNGDLLSCWFQGSGERNANDVAILGARLIKGETTWSAPFLMADTPLYPDCNPVLFLNKENKLFLVWIAVQANRWERSILRLRTSVDYNNGGAPNWNWQDNILLKPDDSFAKEIETKFKNNPGAEAAWAEYAPEYEKMIIEASKDKKKRETGWMTRIHPLILENGEILLPLYSDGFNISMTAISDDGGDSWHCSLPMVGKGNIQPSFIRKTDGILVAYMRDSGDAPGRIMMATSTDEGYSWSFAKDTPLPNPGASIEVLKLKSGNWLLIYNDEEDGRYSLAAGLSDDEGATWKWKKLIEYSKDDSFHYPSVIQTDDGQVHLTYSYFLEGNRKSIKHTSFSEEWLTSTKTQITAHRGASGLAPENTKAAIMKAIEYNADYSELDVQESADGVIVLMHDDKLDRTTSLSGKIWETTYKQLRTADAGTWYSPSFSKEPVPTLQTIIDAVGDKMKLNIELKINAYEEELVEGVVKLIVQNNFIDRCIVTSFDREAIRKIKSLNSQIRTGYIFGTMPEEDIYNGEFDLLSINKRLATKDLLEKAHQHQKEVHVWTVNEAEEMRALINMGVDNIITNYPNILKEVFSERRLKSDDSAIITQEFIYEIDDALTPQCHASTIAESDGVIVSSWFGGTEEKNNDVGIWVSRKINKKWSVPTEVANGIQEDGSRYPCWNPVLFKPKNQPLVLFYKVGPTPREWWGMYKTSEDNGLTWSESTKLPKGILGPIKNQPLQLIDGTILSPTSTESKISGWKIQLEISNDNGKTWTTSGDLNDGEEYGAIQPTILNYGNGKLQLLSRTKQGVIAENWSSDYGKTWSKMDATSLPNPNSGIDGITLNDGRQLLVYNPTGKNWGDRVPLSIAISKDGKNWKRVLDLESITATTDREGEEYSYPTVIQSSDGLVHIVYTWNRKAVKHLVIVPEKI